MIDTIQAIQDTLVRVATTIFLSHNSTHPSGENQRHSRQKVWKQFEQRFLIGSWQVAASDNPISMGVLIEIRTIFRERRAGVVPCPVMKTTEIFPWEHPAQSDFEHLLHRHIADPDFPCVGAKSALAHHSLDILACDRIDSAWDDLRIHDGLLGWARRYQDEPSLFRSFACVFAGPLDLDERGFEKALWARVQSLSDKDVWRGQSYDGRVSSNPENPHFSLSFGGEAFFVVGLHPHSSRPARRFERPTLVFNLHDQFEILRAQGKYEGMREKILKRDEAVAGSRNPMLQRHGEGSEARQYSGRAVDTTWSCPFQYRGKSER